MVSASAYTSINKVLTALVLLALGKEGPVMLVQLGGVARNLVEMHCPGYSSLVLRPLIPEVIDVLSPGLLSPLADGTGSVWHSFWMLGGAFSRLEGAFWMEDARSTLVFAFPRRRSLTLLNNCISVSV
jgi:hypothetical protein